MKTLLAYIVLISVALMCPVLSSASDNDDVIVIDTLSSDRIATYDNGVFDPYSINKPNVTLPSPEAQKLGEYNGYPVSPATGLVDINIPLFNLDFFKLSLPFNLTYHSSGIRIQDEPGMVGYGWTLQPGYRISRIVMGKPDDVSCRITQEIVGNVGVNSPLTTKIQSAVPASVCDNGGSGYDFDTVRYDVQPDIFSISIPKVSASFILENTGFSCSVKMLNSCALKVMPLQILRNRELTLLGFKVLDDQGNVYYFGSEEYSGRQRLDYEEYTNTEMLPAVSSWMLRKIESPQGNTTFRYADYTYNSSFVQECGTLLDNGTSSGHSGVMDYKDLTNNQSYSVSYYNEHPATYNVKLLSGIDNPMFSCSFAYTNGVIASITIKNKDVSPTIVKQISFVHGSDNKFLDRLFVSGEGYYDFTYNRQDGDTKPKAIDWWGYFNGTINQTSNLPSVSLDLVKKEVSNGTSAKFSFGHAANRESKESCMVAKSLIKIKYPTGGIYTINYEANKDDAGNIRGGLRVKSTENYDPVQNTTTVKSYTYSEPHFFSSLNDFKNLITTTKLCYAKHFVISGTLPMGVSYNTVRCRNISTFSSVINMSSTPVYYGKVQETVNGHITTYHYTYNGDVLSYSLTSLGGDVKGYYPTTINHCVNTEPLLVQEETSSIDGNILIRKDYQYETFAPVTYIGRYVVPYLHYVQVPGSSCDGNSNALQIIVNSTTYASYFGEPFAFGTYYLYGGINNLVSTATTTYTPQGSIVQKEQLGYKSSYPYLLADKTQSDSRNGSYTERYYYPFELSSIRGKAALTSEEQNGIQSLQNGNMVSSIIEQDLVHANSSGNEKTIWSKLYGYKMLRSNLVVPTSVFLSKGTGAFVNKIKFGNYDTNGNPTTIIYNVVNTTTVTWNGMYPASVKEGSQTTLYNYNPYVGLLRVTKPNGEVESYKYDDEQRLQEVGNMDGKTVLKFDYYRLNK